MPHPMAFGLTNDESTLYVPIGTFDEYVKIWEWVSAFAKTTDGDKSAITYYNEKGLLCLASLTGSDNTVAFSNSETVEGAFEIPQTVDNGVADYTVTSIDEEAFKDNTLLTEVTIPATVTSIGAGAFAGCSGLTAIYAYATTPANLASATSRTRAGSSSVFEGVDKETCVLYVPQGSLELYRAAEGWGEFTHIVEMDGTGISSVSVTDNIFDVYDMSGRKVRTATTSLDGLLKGIYIVNGKKVMK